MTEQSDKWDNDEYWRRLFRTAYIPCRPDSEFKAGLLADLKRALPNGEDAIRSILTKSYQPVEPSRDFETRLLRKMKEHQRDTVVLRRSSFRRTIFTSAASGIAAAAMVAFVFFLMPKNGTTEAAALPAGSIEVAQSGVSLPLPAPEFDGGSAAGSGSGILPAAYTPGYATDYTVASAFAGSALASSAAALRNIEVNTPLSQNRWSSTGMAQNIALTPGTLFRSADGMGHMEFPDGTLLSLSPDSQLEVTDAGLSVDRGFVLVTVPQTAGDRFRLHFPERDLAVEPGTDLAVMVEDPALFADGGAPAPMVMVQSGLALASGKNGVGPLFASQLYRLDRYVTPELPGRMLGDVEYQDLESFFKAETVRETLPKAAFAGGFSTPHDMSYTTTVLTPAGFTKKGDAWVADTYRGEETIKLKYLSDEYFGFANDRRDLARSLALGASVILDAGDGEFYEIHR